MPWLPTVTTAAPAEEPVSVEEVRAQVQIEAGDSDFDTELNIYIKAARGHVEESTGTRLVTQTVEMKADRFCALARLPMAPLQTVTSIKYLDTNGDEQTLASTVYEAVAADMRPFIRLKPNQAWPATLAVLDAVRVVAVVGYGAAAVLPAKVKLAMLLMIGDWFARREDISNRAAGTPTDNAAAALLSGNKRFRGL